MQLAGDRFTDVSAAFGNDLATMPNFPAEIRAPAGTIAGRASFQGHISGHRILTPRDIPHLLVAMKPAPLKANVPELETRGELFDNPYEVAPARLEPGRYRNITGNLALAYGLIAASQQSHLPLVYASYPITPASDILHELSRHKNFGVRTLQAEDEIAAVGIAIGAAFSGQLGVTATSGPGVDLKSEGMGLAVSLEPPLVVVDVHRGGPSPGLPTQTEQADLLLAMYGRHGDAPLPRAPARSPAPCFQPPFEPER